MSKTVKKNIVLDLHLVYLNIAFDAIRKIIVNVIALFCATEQWSCNLCGIQQHCVLQGWAAVQR